MSAVPIAEGFLGNKGLRENLLKQFISNPASIGTLFCLVIQLSSSNTFFSFDFQLHVKQIVDIASHKAFVSNSSSLIVFSNLVSFFFASIN